MKLSEIALRLGCEMRSDAGDVEIRRVAGIEEAGPGDLTFVSNRKYVRHLKDTRASAVILGSEMPEVPVPTLRTSNPYLAFARALELFFEPMRPERGIHRTAVVAHDARIGAGASIGAYAVIGADCVLGDEVVIYPHVVVYPGARIGDGSILHAHAV